MSMTRTSTRNVWMLTLVVLVGMGLLIYRQALNEADNISQKNYQLRDMRSELDNAARRATALDELDKLTIDERTATRLDILRHLGLEQSGYSFRVNSRQTRTVGDAQLFLREIMLATEIPYAEAMALLDRLHATRKIVISAVELRRPGASGDMVDITIEGSIHGLEKNTQ